jgi:hypothetical protein
MQLSLDTEIIRPGLYSVNRQWKNEMGYTWKRNEHVLVIEHDAPTHCLCSLPDGYIHGLRFHLDADRLRSCFKYIGPLPLAPGHY